MLLNINLHAMPMDFEVLSLNNFLPLSSHINRIFATYSTICTFLSYPNKLNALTLLQSFNQSGRQYCSVSIDVCLQDVGKHWTLNFLNNTFQSVKWDTNKVVDDSQTVIQPVDDIPEVGLILDNNRSVFKGGALVPGPEAVTGIWL